MKVRAIILFTLVYIISNIATADVKFISIYTGPAGSPLLALDESGDMLWQERYQPYGERVISSASSQENNTWFLGRSEFTPDGVLNFNNRAYNPAVGRFYSLDPVGFDERNVQSFNRYLYSNNNPYKFKDPDGDFFETIFDVASLALSVKFFIDDPSIGNALGVLVDGVATIIPGVPGGVGVARNGAKIGIEASQTANTTRKVFSGDEQRAADFLFSLGRNVTPNQLEGVAGAGRQGDALVDGVLTEFKTLSAGATGGTIRNVVNNSIRRGGQARDIVIDARGSGLTEGEALLGVKRAFGISRDKVDRISVIGDNFFIGGGP